MVDTTKMSNKQLVSAIEKADSMPMNRNTAEFHLRIARFAYENKEKDIALAQSREAITTLDTNTSARRNLHIIDRSLGKTNLSQIASNNLRATEIRIAIIEMENDLSVDWVLFHVPVLKKDRMTTGAIELYRR